MSIDSKRAERAAFMRALYDLTDGNEQTLALASDVFAAANLPVPSDDSRRSLLTYLEGEYLVDVLWTLGPSDHHLTISHLGVTEIERLLSAPEAPTEHFPPVSQVNVYVQGSMNNSNIAVGSSHVNQTVSVTDQEASDWARRVIEAVASDTVMAEADRILVVQNAEVLRDRSVELAAADPGRLRALGHAVVSILYGVAGTGTYEGLIQAGQVLFG